MSYNIVFLGDLRINTYKTIADNFCAFIVITSRKKRKNLNYFFVNKKKHYTFAATPKKEF